VKLSVFSVVLCVKLFSYTELHREGTEKHRDKIAIFVDSILTINNL